MSASPHTGLESSRCNQWIQTSYISKKKDKKGLPYGQSVYGLRASLSSFFAILNVFQFWETSSPKRNWICGSVFFTSGVTIQRFLLFLDKNPTVLPLIFISHWLRPIRENVILSWSNSLIRPLANHNTLIFFDASALNENTFFQVVFELCFVKLDRAFFSEILLRDLVFVINL